LYDLLGDLEPSVPAGLVRLRVAEQLLRVLQ
jgi:hypothetical protein